MRWQAIVGGLVCAGVAMVMAPARVCGQVGVQPAGVLVDADGVLRKQVVPDPDGSLTRERIAAAQASLGADVAATSPIRKVSLVRLEAELRARQGVPTDEMRYLAGLQRVRYVFFYPETKDIVLAGPAQGWMNDLTGRVVGMKNGRPVLQLQDLVVALRAFGPGGKETPVVGCSIDPTQEGQAAMNAFLKQLGGRATPAQTEYIVQGMQTSMGKQTISITGVSPQTHFAHVLVEADYRMKLIGIGLEQPPVKLTSYAERSLSAHVAGNALQRWFFVPDYHCVRVSEDRMAMELVGDGVQLVGANEVVSSDGVRHKAAGTNRASQAFVTSFTRKYSDLADRSPIYAELRNVIDLLVAAAFMQQEGYFEKAGWDLGMLGSEKTFAVEIYYAPRQVETAVAPLWKGNQVFKPLVGGGVHIEATEALDSENLLEDEGGKVAELRKKVAPQLAKGQWWWD